MKLTFSVDQKEALRNGIDAPNSTVQLEVNPAELPAEHREILAAAMKDGHDCTKAFSFGSQNYVVLSLPSPDAKGLSQSLQDLVEKRQKEEAERLAKIAKQSAETREKLTKGDSEKLRLRRNKNGEPMENSKCGYAEHEIEVPKMPYLYGDIDAETQALIETKRAEIEAERERLIAEADREIFPKLIAEENERRAKIEAEESELVKKLPETFRRKREAGFVTNRDWEDAIRGLIAAEIGGEEADWKWNESESLERLSDDEFFALESLQSKLGNEYELTPKKVWHAEYRPAEEDDDPEDIDGDGEVLEKIDPRYVVTTEVRKAGRSVTVAFPLTATEPV